MFPSRNDRMKTLLWSAAVAIGLILLAGVYAAAPPSPEEGKLQQELQKLFQASADAIRKGDPSLFVQSSADDYTLIDSFGVVRDKAATLDFLKSCELESWKIAEVTARLYGATAVAVARSSAKGRIGGVDVTGDYLATSVLVNRDGK